MTESTHASDLPPTYDECLRLIWALLADGQVAAANTVYAATAAEIPPRPILAIALHTAGGLLAIAQGQRELANARWYHAIHLAEALLVTSDDLSERMEAERLWDDCHRFLLGDIS